VITSAVGAFLLCVAAERALHCSASHDVALMVAGMVRPRAVAAALALYVALSATVLAPAVWTCIRELFDSVPHSHHIDAFVDQSSRHLALLY